MDFLDFEKPIVELERRIDELKLTNTNADTAIELDDEIEKLQKKSESLTRKIFANLSEWQIAQLARHPLRPKSIQVIESISEDFQELHGDRMYADDSSIVSGLAKIESRSVMIIAQEKGNNTNEKMKRNFGMPRPEGYRKAQRMMKLAEKFSIPIVTIIDTPGAFPGVGAEERGQSEAIARNLAVMSSLKTKILVVVSGEGGSGGALALGVGDHIAILEYGTYSVASPEACASIVWRESDKAPEAAEAMKVGANDLKKIGIVDEIIPEPVGGAHQDYDMISANIKLSLLTNIAGLSKFSQEELLQRRYQRLLKIGA